MIETDALHARGKALEDEYFHRVDDKLRQQLKASMERDEAKRRLAEASRIEDNLLLDHLLDANMDSASLAALVLVPLAFVAWSDGQVSVEERQSVMHEVMHRGVSPRSKPFQLVESWLEHRPTNDLGVRWEEYLAGVTKVLSSDASAGLRTTLMKRCQEVAEASAGLFGTNRVSKPEQEMLEKIRVALGLPKED
ncbi:MAG: hypothetical protein AAGA03_15340 [Planctomycetota bacterium]